MLPIGEQICHVQQELQNSKTAGQKSINSEETSIKNQIKLYPNPASKSSLLTVSVPDEYSKGKLTIYDFNGRMVDTKSLNSGDNQYELQNSIRKLHCSV
jgi:hypothetical protein